MKNQEAMTTVLRGRGSSLFFLAQPTLCVPELKDLVHKYYIQYPTYSTLTVGDTIKLISEVIGLAICHNFFFTGFLIRSKMRGRPYAPQKWKFYFSH